MNTEEKYVIHTLPQSDKCSSSMLNVNHTNLSVASVIETAASLASSSALRLPSLSNWEHTTYYIGHSDPYSEQTMIDLYVLSLMHAWEGYNNNVLVVNPRHACTESVSVVVLCVCLLGMKTCNWWHDTYTLQTHWSLQADMCTIIPVSLMIDVSSCDRLCTTNTPLSNFRNLQEGQK